MRFRLAPKSSTLDDLERPKRVKLHHSNLAVTFRGPSEPKPIKNFGKKNLEKRERGREYRVLSQVRVKLRTSNFVHTFT